MATSAVGLSAAYAARPVAATVIGAAAAPLRPPGSRTRSGLQHFAAGIVFSVAAVELLPDVTASHTPPEIAFAFSLGVLLMLGLRGVLAESADGGATASLPLTLLTAVAIDVFVDGVLLGIGFTLGAGAGRLLAFALALEALSLGVATTLALTARAVRHMRVLAIMLGVALLFLVGGLLGAALLSGLSAHALSLVAAFALAALLYLVTEELLAEAHETPDVPLVTALFFLGFLIFLVLGMLERS